MSNTLFSFLGWTFLPDVVTGSLQSFYYNLTTRAGEAKPQPGSQTFVRHRRRIYTFVILAYLVYTLYEAHWQIRRAGDFYDVLGVPHDVNEKALQTRFRRLTVQYHPDKISADSEQRVLAEKYYIHLKLARDTILDPAKRFAYDRFGPDITQWHQCVTVKDFLMLGLRGLGPFYVASGAFMLFLGYLGFFDWGKYWRYLLFVALGLFELHTVTRPNFPSATNLPIFFNPVIAALQGISSSPWLKIQQPYLPFQIIRIAHTATIAIVIALSRLGPMLESSGDKPAQSGSAQSGNADQALDRQLQRLEQLASANAMEATRLHALELVPFTAEGGQVRVDSRGNARPLQKLKTKVQEWFVTNTVRSDKEVQEAVGRVLAHRRGEASTDDVSHVAEPME